MPNQVVWPKCNVFDDEGVPTVLQRGELIPDGVDDTQLEMLMIIGAVRPVEYVREAAESVPEDATVPAGGLVVENPEPLQKPSPNDPKPAWIAYASDERNPDRISESQAGNMTRSALVARYSEPERQPEPESQTPSQEQG